jgi:MGT family glycosyltransferase
VSRVFLGAFGQPGHAFPMLALGRALVARGHRVTFETWSRWREHVEAAGMRFVAAPEYPTFPTLEQPIKPYQAVEYATAFTRSAMEEAVPDVVVHDILTLAPAMAAELLGVPAATLIPHVYPVGGPGFPPYAFGARLPRTALGRRVWDGFDPLLQAGLRRGRAELNATRERLGLAPVTRLHGGLSSRLCLVATLPQLEYPREWPSSVHVVGPMVWEPPYQAVEPPPGDAPLVLVAPSTAQDPDQVLLRAAVAGLACADVRVLATWNRRRPVEPVAAGANTRVVEWISYGQSMPGCALVICHAGHGTMVRALAAGCPVLAIPHSGDMAENAARADWAGLGARLPWRLVSPLGVRLAVQRVLRDRALRARVAEVAAWAAEHDGAVRGAELVEELAAAG